MNSCAHAIRIGNLCGDCGLEIQSSDRLYYLYNTDKVQLVEDRALEMQEKEVMELEKMKKLVLILDLDQTVLHTTIEARAYKTERSEVFKKSLGLLDRHNKSFIVGRNDIIDSGKIGYETGDTSSYANGNVESTNTNTHATAIDDYANNSSCVKIRASDTSDHRASLQNNYTKTPQQCISLDACDDNNTLHNLANIHYFEMDGLYYKVKLRPNTASFLESISRLYKIYVYTMGTRSYADKIIQFLDPERKYFGDRILSRDENVGRLDKRLSRLFPTKHHNIVILDDRADVWNWSKNLMLIRPYWFFNKVDINDPQRIKEESDHGKQGTILCDSSKAGRIKASDRENRWGLQLRDKESFARPLDGCNKDIIANKNSSLKIRLSTGNKLLNQSVQDCVVYQDSELLKIKRMLADIHVSYFSGLSNTKKLLHRLRSPIFGGMIFYIPREFIRRPLRKLIKLYGGVVSTKNIEYVLCSDLCIKHRLARKRKCALISVGWVLECAYAYKRVSLDNWIVRDYREKDEYEEELEKEFFC